MWCFLSFFLCHGYFQPLFRQGKQEEWNFMAYSFKKTHCLKETFMCRSSLQIYCTSVAQNLFLYLSFPPPFLASGFSHVCLACHLMLHLTGFWDQIWHNLPYVLFVCNHCDWRALLMGAVMSYTLSWSWLVWFCTFSFWFTDLKSSRQFPFLPYTEKNCECQYIRQQNKMYCKGSTSTLYKENISHKKIK